MPRSSFTSCCVALIRCRICFSCVIWSERLRCCCVFMAELLRENKRALDKSIREIERERQNLQNQEKKLIAEIKKTAKQGQMVSVQTWAWNLWSSIRICFFGRKGLVQACELLAFMRFEKLGFTFM